MASMLISLAAAALLYKSASNSFERTFNEVTRVVEPKPDERQWYPKGHDPQRDFRGSLRGPEYPMALPKWEQRRLGVPPSRRAQYYHVINEAGNSLINPESAQFITPRYKERYLVNLTQGLDQLHWRLDPLRGGVPKVAGAPIQILEPTASVVPRWAVSKQ